MHTNERLTQDKNKMQLQMQIYKYLLLFSLFIYILIILYFHSGILKTTTNHLEQHVSPWNRKAVLSIKQKDRFLNVKFINRSRLHNNIIGKKNNDYLDDKNKQDEYENSESDDSATRSQTTNTKCKTSGNTSTTDNCGLGENGSFHTVGNIYIFSAYFDNRNMNSVRVRIIGMRRLDDSDMLICGYKSDFYTFQTLAEEYELSENHGKLFGGWIFSCQLPSLLSTHPRYLFLGRATEHNSGVLDFDKATIVPVMNNINRTDNSTKSNHTMGVCVPPIFGDISFSLLLQFVELTRILGANHIIIYNYNVSTNIEKILRYYQHKDVVTLVNWKIPTVISEKQIWYHGQLLAIQDCLYRNMNKFKFLSFADLDEFIIPRKNYNWTDMIRNVVETIDLQQKIEHIAGFSFKSAFFSPRQVPDSSQQLLYLQLLKRTLLLSSLRTKVIVYPEKIFEMGIHHISKTLYGNLTVIDVPSNIGIIHHYRLCNEAYEHSMDCNIMIQDTDILRYATKLLDKYRSTVLDTVKLFIPKRNKRTSI